MGEAFYASFTTLCLLLANVVLSGVTVSLAFVLLLVVVVAGLCAGEPRRLRSAHRVVQVVQRAELQVHVVGGAQHELEPHVAQRRHAVLVRDHVFRGESTATGCTTRNNTYHFSERKQGENSADFLVVDECGQGGGAAGVVG